MNSDFSICKLALDLTQRDSDMNLKTKLHVILLAAPRLELNASPFLQELCQLARLF